jgi:hypothetical protein
MRFKVIATDFDGTLASDDRIGQAALAALAAAQEAGITLVLVTGRTFFELTRVCEHLDRFDAVVAENGAVLYFPQQAMIRDQGPAPPHRLLAELEQRSIHYQAGRVVVGTHRADEGRVRDALAAAGVTRDLVYNRSALMLLPAGINKGTGVQHVLRSFGVSFHDALALGDAENDLPLFDACGWAACPENAVPELKARADWVLDGPNGGAVATAIGGPLVHGRLEGRRSPRHQISLGWVVPTAEAATLPARDINVLVVGDTLSGKSWLAGAMVERLRAARYAVCVLDPEGDYRVLKGLPGVTWVDVRDRSGLDRILAAFEPDPAACVVADLSALIHSEKVEMIEASLGKIRALRRRRGLPHWVFLDEVQYSLHREGIPAGAIGLEDKGFCLVTYRPSWLADPVMAAVDVLILARAPASEELSRLGGQQFCGVPNIESALAAVPTMPAGEFLLVDPVGQGAALTFVADRRETAHVRHLRKYVDSVVPSDQRFVFRHPDARVAGEARSLGEFRREIAAVGDDVLADHAGRGDFSRWVLDVFADRELAKQIAKTEARWSRGEVPDLRRAIDQLVALRYGDST